MSNSSQQRRLETPDGFGPGTPQFTAWTKAYYQQVETYDWVDAADRLQGIESLFHRKRQREIRGLFARYGQARGLVLDAGCGTGLNLRHLPEGSVGLDINPRNIELVAKRLPTHPAVLGDIEAMPFDDEAFSTVLCTEVLEHLPNPELALAEIRRVLAPGGCLIGMVPARAPVWKLRFLSRSCPHTEPFHNEYRVNEVRAMMTDAGFQTERANYSLGWFSVIFIAHKPSV